MLRWQQEPKHAHLDAHWVGIIARRHREEVDQCFLGQVHQGLPVLIGPPKHYDLNPVWDPITILIYGTCQPWQPAFLARRSKNNKMRAHTDVRAARPQRATYRSSTSFEGLPGRIPCEVDRDGRMLRCLLKDGDGSLTRNGQRATD